MVFAVVTDCDVCEAAQLVFAIHINLGLIVI
jgi:hypothetical protein